MLESTLLNGCFANGTLLTSLRWPITFLGGTSLKYSCKSILDKSHRCVLAPLSNNIFRSILFFFPFLLHYLGIVCLCPLPMRPAPTIDRREARSRLQPTRRAQCCQPQIRSRQYSYISLPIPDECNFKVDVLMLPLTIMSFSTPLTI